MKYRAVCKYLELHNPPTSLHSPHLRGLLHCSPATETPGLFKEDREMFLCCNYVSTEHQVPKESTRPCQASSGSNNAPRTEAYYSGLCLFIWKCYSPLSSAVKKGL